MRASGLPSHISAQFDQELEDIRALVLKMGGIVEDHLIKAVTAMIENDRELAHTVATEDYRVNAMEVSIDEECTQILARRQPAAGDLRLVLAVTKTITDLERIGDEVEKIGRMTLSLMDSNIPRSYYVGVESIGSHVQRMLHDALDAFARMDSLAAIRIAAEDAKVDAEYNAAMRLLITYMMEDPRNIGRVLEVLWSIRALERIGDHITNICEYVIYLVEGKDVRHTRLEQVEEELSNSGSDSSDTEPA